jgi:signal transduction histidine kinase
MRARLIRSTLLVVVIAVVTLGGPLLVVARHQVWASANERLRQQATTLAAEFEDRLTAGQEVDLSRISDQLPAERVVITQPHRTPETGGSSLTGKVRRESVTVGNATVTVEVSAAPTIDKARQVTLLVIGLVVLSAIIGVALAMRQARHLAAPLAGLADHADALGAGDFTPSQQVSGISEVDAIARVLDRSAARIGELVTLQQELASDAAHQLRTPLTGIGLRLEEITRIGDPDSRQEADAALAQVERLNQVISSLLGRARGDAQEPVTFDLAELVRDETAVWGRVLNQHHRNLTTGFTPGAMVRARRDHVTQILSSLLDNAMSHGAGDVSIQVTREDDMVAMAVADQGLGVPRELRPRIFERAVSGKSGTGIGLALARSLAEGEGGSLEISPASAAELVLRLPVAPVSATSGH